MKWIVSINLLCLLFLHKTDTRSFCDSCLQIINAFNLTSIKLIRLAYYGNTRSHSNIWCLLLWDTFLNINIDFQIMLKLFKIKTEQIKRSRILCFTRGRKKSFKIDFNKLEKNIWVWIHFEKSELIKLMSKIVADYHTTFD